MNLELWLAFAVTYTVISAIPGPSVLMVLGLTLSHGPKTAAFCILGDILGGLAIISLAFLGVGTILAASAELFQALKWAGILYMIYLGIQQIRVARKATQTTITRTTGKQGFQTGFLTGILNPKAILFYVAFLPQFMDPTYDALVQILMLSATSSAIVLIILSLYLLMAVRISRAIQSPSTQRYIGYAGGGCLLGGATAMAITR
ncbi:LysE family translocator [Coralliovum pocilloporae]|uniref:LysE family translocator n=1 Tax=Coralliovum pocilloporae TaxID=3066369 RepID=UPI0033075F9F